MNYLQKISYVAYKIVLWGLGLFIILGGLTSISKSIAAGVMLILCGLLIAPLGGRMLRGLNGGFNWRIRCAAIVFTFTAAIMLYPSQPDAGPVSSVVEQRDTVQHDSPKTPIQPVSSQLQSKIVQSPKVVSFTQSSDKKINVQGYGPADASVRLLLSSGKHWDLRTDKSGYFIATLAATTTPYGSIKLQRSEGSWIFQKYVDLRIYYYSLFDSAHPLSEVMRAPIVTNVTGSGGKVAVEGFYLPKQKLILKYKDKQIRDVKTDANGYFNFKNIDAKEHYMELTISKKVSTGIFSSKNEPLSLSYVDTQEYQMHRELPAYTRTEVKKNPINYLSRTVHDDAMPKDEKKVTQVGVNGERTITYTVSYKGDQEVKRAIVSDQTTLAPVDQVTAIGTYVVPSLEVAPPSAAPVPVAPPSVSTYYSNCSAARAAGVAPLYSGEPGYRSGLDRDHDGVACE